MTTAEQARQLIDRYLRGECTEQERALVERFYLEQLQEQPLPEITAGDAKSTIWAKIHEGRNTPTRKISRWLPYAAAVLLVASVVGWWAISIRPSAISTDIADIQPGGNRATLTLADGRVINLDEAQTGIVVGTEDITYTDGTSLGAVMVSGVEPSQPNSAETHSTPLRSLPTGQAGLPTGQAGAQNDGPVMLALTTPKGGTYQITLPDGSKVWLNSASTLKYPSRFSGNSREVILEGEAFFDIVSMDRARNAIARERSGSGTRDTRAPASNFNSDGARDSDGARVARVPFKVRTSTQTVEVLGTEFNISAYADDPETKTTLVEGKVRVAGLVGAQYLARNKSGVQLSPGQQATSRGAQFEIREVDTEQYTSWKSGLFVFNDEPLEAILKQVARWYDVEVVYTDDNLRGLALWGKVSRNTPISSVLNALALTEKVTFRLEAAPAGSAAERRLVVMP